MTTFLLRADAVLRGQAPVHEEGQAHPLPLLAIIVAYGGLYGALMGTFGGAHGDRYLQVVYSAVKVPFLLLVTGLISLPPFFVLHGLFGLHADFPRALRALLAGQAGLTVVLASLAPFTLLWYASSGGYEAAILFNGVVFAAASVTAQWLMRRYYAPLMARDARHRWMLRAWLLVYAFVGIQMGWVLRPFAGAPWGPTRFFRPDSWGNAYVVVARIVHHALW